MGGGYRVPGPDLQRPVDQRVAALGTPVVRGIGAGGEFLAGRLAMFAILFPEKRADAAMAEVERMADDPILIAQRPARIATLEREIDELSHVEEALIEAAVARAIHRSASALPQAVLGVRIAER